MTKIEKRTSRHRVVITMFWDENKTMIKQKTAAIITPLILSSWIDF